MNSAVTARARTPRSVELDRPRLEAREVEQPGGKLAQAVDLLADVADELAAGLLVELLVLDQLEEAAEREDRRAELVRGGGDEALAGGVELLQLELHLVERRGELAELVGRVDQEAPAEVAAGHPAGRPLESLDPQAEGAGDQRAGQEGEGEGDEPGDQDLPPDQRHRGLDVAEGDGEQRHPGHPPGEEDRQRDGAGRRARARHPPAHRPAPGRRAHDEGQAVGRRRVALDSRLGDRVGVQPRRARADPEQGQVGAGPVGRVAHRPLDARAVDRRPDRAGERREGGGRRRLEGGQLLAAEARLQRRRHVGVDAGDRHQGDDEEEQGEAVADRPGQRPAHPPQAGEEGAAALAPAARRCGRRRIDAGRRH
jgi:hypothetical protein